jgi:hypothetical protein
MQSTRAMVVLLFFGATGCGSDDEKAGTPGDSTPVAGCTRESLAGVVDAYFSALEARDATALPVAAGVKFTENGSAIALGDGLWQSAGAQLFRRNALDAERCGTLTQAVIEENGSPIIFGLRLGLVERKIAEIETYVARSTEFAFKPQGIIDGAAQDWEGILPVEQRSTREELNAAANAYFDLFQDPATAVPFGTPCDRWENGTQTTNGDCSAGVPGGLAMTGRRYPIADTESGIAAGFVLFSGSLLDFHMFKLKSGKIHIIHAVVGPRVSSSGWPAEG